MLVRLDAKTFQRDREIEKNSWTILQEDDHLSCIRSAL